MTFVMGIFADMKRQTRFLVSIGVILVLLATNGCQQPIRDEEQLAVRLLNALHDIDIESFRETFLTKKDYHEVTLQMRKISGLEDAEDDALMRSWEEYQLLITEMFRSIIDEGVQTGIRWSEVEIIAIVPGNEVVENYMPPTIKMLDDVSIRFRSGSSTYLLRFYDPVRIKDSWKISSHLYLLHKEG